MMTRWEPFCIGLLRGRRPRLRPASVLAIGTRSRGPVCAAETFAPAAKTALTTFTSTPFATALRPHPFAHGRAHRVAFFFVQLAITVLVELLHHLFAIEPAAPASATFAAFTRRTPFPGRTKPRLRTAALPQRSTSPFAVARRCKTRVHASRIGQRRA